MSPQRCFAFRLAKELGYANPEYMLASMPWRVFQEWIQYSEIEPFGEERADLRAAIVSATIANCTARGKGKPAFRPSQFMPEFGPPKPRRVMSPEAQLQQMIMATRALGGTIKYVDGPIGNRGER